MTRSPSACAIPERALDRPLLIKSFALSVLLHLLLVVMFREAIGVGDDAGTATDVDALRVRLKLRWTRPDIAPIMPGADLPLRRSPPQEAPSAPVTAHPSPPSSDAGREPAARVEAEPLPLSRSEPPVMRALPRAAPLLAEPPPLPRVIAEPLSRSEAPVMRALPRDAPLLAEPPPLPRIEAEPIASGTPAAAPALRPVPHDAAPLAEPPPLPRIDAEPIASGTPATAPALRPVPQDAAPLAEPRGAPAGPPPVDESPPATAAAPPAARAAPGVTAPASGPARLDFGPRRTVDPDLAAIVGEPAPNPAPAPGESGRLDLDATRALARNLNRAPVRTKSGRPIDLSPPKPDAESTLGRAIGKAAQPDCRVAYAGWGLLGVPFLLFDTVTDTGCRW